MVFHGKSGCKCDIYAYNFAACTFLILPAWKLLQYREVGSLGNGCITISWQTGP